MSGREEMLGRFYRQNGEDMRLSRSRHGQLEFLTTMNYIHRLSREGASVLEVGAGTGRYSITLAKEGYEVTAVELVEHQLEILKQNSRGMERLRACQGDALDLSRFEDDTFDLTLVLGPLYHLYDRRDQQRALDEAIRVTRRGGVVMVAFLSVHAILFSNYLRGNFRAGLEENFTKEYQVRHFEEQLFTGFEIEEFENLFQEKPMERIATVAVDGILELAEGRSDFSMPEEDFAAFTEYHLRHCENRELLGSSSHLLYIGRKK